MHNGDLHVAIEEIKILISRLSGHIADKLITLRNINVSDNHVCAKCSPSLEEPFSKSTGSPSNENGLVFHPGIIDGRGKVQRRRLSDGVSDGILSLRL